MPKNGRWLFKTEPSEFSINDLFECKDQTTAWTGIRNFLARNILRDRVQLHDQVMIYHSSTAEKGIAGIAEVVKAAYPDPTAFDPKSAYFDRKSSPQLPTWMAVDVKLVEIWTGVLPLATLRQTAGLESMMLLQRGARLSIQPVTPGEWLIISRVARQQGLSIS